VTTIQTDTLRSRKLSMQPIMLLLFVLLPIVSPAQMTKRLVRYDLERGTAEEHSFGTDAEPGGPGEAVFAPAHSNAGELSGWYLSYIYDPVRDGSDLVIIDASDFRAKPVARVQLPRRVPYGFHGNWIAD